MTYPSSSQPEPEPGIAARRLLTAIVRRAVLDFATYRDASTAAHQRLHEEVAEWLFSDAEDETECFAHYSFILLCKLLQLDPKGIREQALALTREDLHRFSADLGQG